MSDIDFNEIAEVVDQLRETCRAVVAGLMDDGFTEREARAICAGVFAMRSDERSEEDPS